MGPKLSVSVRVAGSLMGPRDCNFAIFVMICCRDGSRFKIPPSSKPHDPRHGPVAGDAWRGRPAADDAVDQPAILAAAPRPAADSGRSGGAWRRDRLA